MATVTNPKQLIVSDVLDITASSAAAQDLLRMANVIVRVSFSGNSGTLVLPQANRSNKIYRIQNVTPAPLLVQAPGGKGIVRMLNESVSLLTADALDTAYIVL